MRRTRWLLLLLIVLIVAGVGVTYSIQRERQEQQKPATPARLPDQFSAQLSNWTWSHTHEGRTLVEAKATSFRQLTESSKVELEGVELKLNHKDAKAFDLVRSAKAVLDTVTGVLFSDGEVEIIMGVPAEGQEAKPTGKLVKIKSSGVEYDSKTGKAKTDRAASFTFDRGEGSSTGAEYDPALRELRMHKDVSLKWNGASPGDKAMEVQSGALLYKELESKVFLTSWSKLKRDSLTLEAADSTVSLNEGVIQLVEAQKAHGTDQYPNRKIDYAANELRMKFNPKGQMEQVLADGDAKLTNTSDTTQTAVTAQRLDLQMEATATESTLKKAMSYGNSVVEAKPLPRPGVLPADTRILRSDTIELNMRAGGREVEKVITHAPGTIEFIPNRTGQKRREMKGERMTIDYGEQNQLKRFAATTVSTRTEREPVKGKPAPPALTWSKELVADFDQKTGQMTRLEQWDDFRYEEGERRAKSDKAVLENPAELITLLGKARMWDPGGSTAADQILLQQQSGDVEATGNVVSTRLPEKKKDAKTGMLAGNEPVQARAARMTTKQDNSQIRYDGKAIMWQSANRLEADQIYINRETDIIEAHGNVVSQFLEQPKGPKKKQGIFTIVKAPHMVYRDKEHLAHYTGGVVLNRPDMQVDSKELRAFLKQTGSETDLDKAIADGTVKIVQSAPDRTRTGTGEHAEYYVAEEKVILNGGQPQLVDTVRGTTRGRQLTYYSGNDRLLVDGADAQPSVSKIRKK
jgi:lipopolysaccharide export system protein LptA